MRLPLTIFSSLFLIVQLSFGQKENVPNDIDEAIQILQKDCPGYLQYLISETNEDSLVYLIQTWSRYSGGRSYNTISNWIYEDQSPLVKYYQGLGITSTTHIEKIILIAFRNKLNGNSINHQGIIKPFQIKEEKWAKEDSVRFTTDSLRGIYIPKDLEDCFKQIDKFWDDSTKNKVKQLTEDEFSGRLHHGFGTWIRNNWQLWGGSRLSKYFNVIGVYHPDDMSGIILDSYHRNLIGKEIKLEEQVKFYQDYWKDNKNKK